MSTIAALLVAALRDPEVVAALRDALGDETTDAWLTLEEAGAIARCNARVIRDAGRRGELEINRASRSPRVRCSEVDRWLASGRGNAAPKNNVVALSPRDAARAAVAARRAG